MDDCVRNEQYHKEGLLGDSAEALLIRNNQLYNNVRSKTWNTSFVSHDSNMEYRVGCQDGARFVQYTQHNVPEIIERCKRARELHASGDESWRVIFPYANYPAMDLPKVIFHEISHKYFDGKAWDTIKRDPYEKNQFYRVVNQEYPEFVTHGSGKIPIAMKVTYPKARTN